MKDEKQIGMNAEAQESTQITSTSQLKPKAKSCSSFILHSSSSQRGFTLIELIVVVTIIGILAAIAVVNVRNAQRKAQEAALMDDLHEMRKALDDYYADKQHYPSDLH